MKRTTNKFQYVIVAMTLSFLSVSTYVHSQDASLVDSHAVGVYFRLDEKNIDEMHMSNSEAFNRLDNILEDVNMLSELDTLTIIATSSPEGECKYNLKLAQARVLNLKQTLVSRYPILEIATILEDAYVVDWHELKRYIEADYNMPWRDEVLKIINQGRGVESIKLKQLKDGESWRYIKKNVLPYFRNGDIFIRLRIKVPSLDLGGDHSMFGELNNKPVTRDGNILKSNFRDAYLGKEDEITKDLNIRFALKTNLLYDILATPNIALEIPIGNHWSIQGEWTFPWWVSSNNSKALQILSGNIEGRYWLGSKINRSRRQLFTGHFFGLYVNAGIYDLQNDEGYQGEFNKSVGFSYGYGVRLTNSFNMEFSVGFGYLSTDYSKYKLKNNELVWQSDNSYTWVGPTKANISLVWLIGNKKRGDRR